MKITINKTHLARAIRAHNATAGMDCVGTCLMAQAYLDVLPKDASVSVTYDALAVYPDGVFSFPPKKVVSQNRTIKTLISMFDHAMDEKENGRDGRKALQLLRARLPVTTTIAKFI